MERKLATIAKILEIHPIPGADAIEVATIRGWQVVIKKGEFKPGELCIYCEIDSVLPEWDEFAFLAKSNYRIKTIKLRGQVSQGIAFPLYLLFNMPGGDKIHIAEDEDITEFLCVKKYEPVIPAQLQGLVKGNFPTFIQKTDEERIQNIPWVLEESAAAGRTYYITEKVDGTSSTFYIRDGEFGVCSRNMELLESEGNTYWRIARQYNLMEKMSKYRSRFGGPTNFAIQGEILGEGIQGNHYGLKGVHLFVYSAFDIQNHEYFNLEMLRDIVDHLELTMVPVIGYNYILSGYSVEEILKLADGQSMLNPNVIREGIVIRSQSGDKTPRISTGYFSFKAISNNYLLKSGRG